MQKIQILFPEPQMKRLREAARREDRPISEIVRRATEDYLRKLPVESSSGAATQLPEFEGGGTLAPPERFRELAYADRTGPAAGGPEARP